MKTMKILAALLTAVTMTAGSITMTANAADKETAAAEETEGKQYDIDNAAYRAEVDSLIRAPYEKEIVEYLNTRNGNRSYSEEVVHFYYNKRGEDGKHGVGGGWGAYAEYKCGEKTRMFHDISVNFDQSYIPYEDKFSDADEVISKVNAFMKENSLNGEFKKTENEHYFKVEFDESCTEGDKAKAWTALKKEYGISCEVISTALAMPCYTDGIDVSNEQFYSLFGDENTQYKERDHYDINNAAYKRYVDIHLRDYKLINDPRLLRVVNALSTFTGKAVNIYKKENSEYERYSVEYEMPDGSRVFDLERDIDEMRRFDCQKDNGELYTMEELEAFAKKYNYDITFERYRDNGKKISLETMENNPEKALYGIGFSDKYSLAERLEINIIMNKELGIMMSKEWGIEFPIVNRYDVGDNIFFKDGCDCGFYKNGLRIYTDGSSHGETEEITFDTEPNTKKDIPVLPTVLGDADMSGIVDLADLTTVAKYNLSSESFPLENEIAFANSDMNCDGIVDGLDISVMIEKQLGKK